MKLKDAVVFGDSIAYMESYPSIPYGCGNDRVLLPGARIRIISVHGKGEGQAYFCQYPAMPKAGDDACFQLVPVVALAADEEKIEGEAIDYES